MRKKVPMKLHVVARRFRRIAFGLLAVAASAIPTQTSQAVIIFSDSYPSSASLSNYTASTDANSSWNVNTPGLLSYSTTDGGFASSDLLTNPSAASTAGYKSFTVSGIINSPGNGANQPGIVISGDNTNGGFLIEENAGNYSGQFVLLHETGGQLLGDEGNLSATPPFLATFGSITHPNDSYQITAQVTEYGQRPVFTVSIEDLTDSTYLAHNVVVSVPFSDMQGYGDLIGWRVRPGGSGDIPYTFTGLTLSIPEPSAILLGGLGAVGLGAIAYRRRKRPLQPR